MNLQAPVSNWHQYFFAGSDPRVCDAALRVESNTAFRGVFPALIPLINELMDPYSHPNAPNIPRQEVSDAIDAVAAFLDLVRKN